MLVIISDLHLTDGTSGSTISPGAFTLLAESIADLALGASQRRDGSYRPIERVDLVLLGDVLDVIRSSRWLQAKVRPWDDPNTPAFFEMVSAITADILRKNDQALGEFRSLAKNGVLIPPATRDGRCAKDHTTPVPVHIHYMVGNHDWFYHLPGENYSRLRRQIALHLGLITNPNMPFPHEAWECNELLQTMRRHKVFARHGDVYDPFNYEGDRNASSLGDVIVIELLNRFGAQVARELSEDLSESALAGFREIDNIRPLLLVPAWIDGLLERSCPHPATRKQVKKIWDALADQFLEHPFVQHRDTWCPVDIVDGLQKALKFSRRLSVGWASWIAQWMWSLRGADNSSYFSHALSEQDFRNRRAKHIVYGHTHHHECVPLDASFAEGFVLNQAYFNSGTWRRVYEQTRFAHHEHEFIAADALTYLAFFKDDERRGRPYETWTGTLGLAPITCSSTHRVDSGVTSDAAAQPISTPKVPLRAPTSPYRLLRSGPPTEPSSAEFAERMAAAGRKFADAGVAAIYLIHGTFAGNDGLGVFTELERIAPSLAQSCRRCTKRAFNALLGETGNYTPQFAQRMEESLAAGAARTIPVRLFNWSGMNHHIARADAAVRLICELASITPPPSKGNSVVISLREMIPLAEREGYTSPPSKGHARGKIETSPDKAPRVLLWAHSHGGNALAILTNLLAADDQTRTDFFNAARIFFDGHHAPHSGFTAWPRAEQILADPNHPLRGLALDIVTFGTPVRYGWDAGGFSKLLHIINHRTHRRDAEFAAPYPPNPFRLIRGAEGDFIQHVGLAGTNFPPLPLAYKTFLADHRLGRILQDDLKRQWIRARLKCGPRVAEDGTTLLIDYDDPDRLPFRHLLGHAPYTRSRWMALHAALVAEHFYTSSSPTV